MYTQLYTHIDNNEIKQVK